MASVFVTIPVAATWPSADELKARNAVIAAVDTSAVGISTGAGGGLGAMDFSYSVADVAAARAVIERAMTEHMPATEYEVRLSD
jgi:hypothetical protein